MVKKEVEGKVGPFGGRKSNEFTEKYEYIKDGIIAAEKINRGEECTEERIAKVITARVVLQDSSPSEIRDTLDNGFNRIILECNEKGECSICENFIRLQSKDKRRILGNEKRQDK
jgi:hypothetical protein